MMLIDVATLAGRLDDPRQVIVDCRYNLLDPAAGRGAWTAGHIPGAYYADLGRDLAGPKHAGSGRHPLPDPAIFTAWVARLGIGPGVQVAVYDDAGGQMAARLWWLLRWIGHQEVALVDGGFPAWLAAGFPISTVMPTGRSPAAPGRAGQMPVIDTAEVLRSLGTGRWRLIDLRARARFRGEQEPIDPVAGHIPGAANAPFTDTLDPAGHFRSAEALRTYFLPLLNGHASATVAAMCGSGVTACHGIFTLELAGFPGVHLYAGSWSEWIQSTARPIATGDA